MKTTVPNSILLNGDCLEQLKIIPDNSIGSLVTDPPAGISFMGKGWDDDKGGRKHWIAWMTSVMSECLRVMKPGAHGLVWALPRTSHWTATALEDAGFEVRDVVTHLFGSGFPKSLDVSKAIDKAAGAEREVLGVKSWPTQKNGRSGLGSKSMQVGTCAGTQVENFHTAPATDAAKKWQGFGTALKPASEHWILIRKPISEKTVAANVLKWGTGAINIDVSRISTTEDTSRITTNIKGGNYVGGNGKGPIGGGHSQGRFPANLVLSHTDYCTESQCDIECAIKMLDGQSGNLKNGGQNKSSHRETWLRQETAPTRFAGDSGGASRFFYCAKASKADKGADNTHPTVKASKLMQYLIRMITPPNGVVLDPFMGSGSTGVAARSLGFDFIGIEKEPEYFEIAEKRVSK